MAMYAKFRRMRRDDLAALRGQLFARDGVDANDVILAPDTAVVGA